MVVVPMLAAVLSMAAQVGVVEEGRDTISVTGVGHERTIDCQGRAVAIAGTGHRLTFTGTCASLDLTGSDNRITITLAPNAPLNVQGTRQTVRWSSSGSVRQSVVGYGNSVSQQR